MLIRVFFAFAVLTSQTACIFHSSSGKEAKAVSKDDGQRVPTTLSVLSSHELPLTELSGLSLWPGGGGAELAARYLAISDKDFAVVSFGLASHGKISGSRSIDLKKVVTLAFEAAGLSVPEAPQWEGVTADAQGNVFLLEENPGAVYVFNPALDTVRARIKLTLPKNHALANDWEKDPNSRGEGILLLTQGHFLILKEKNPVALIEFGPAGEDPVGFSAATSVSSTAAFALSKEVAQDYVPLQTWTLGKEATKTIDDASEMTLGADGKIHIVSDKSEVVVRLEENLKPSGEEVSFERVWTLPEEIAKPEALVALADGSMLLGIDAKKVTTNVFRVANAKK